MEAAFIPIPQKTAEVLQLHGLHAATSAGIRNLELKTEIKPAHCLSFQLISRKVILFYDPGSLVS